MSPLPLARIEFAWNVEAKSLGADVGVCVVRVAGGAGHYRYRMARNIGHGKLDGVPQLRGAPVFWFGG